MFSSKLLPQEEDNPKVNFKSKKHLRKAKRCCKLLQSFKVLSKVAIFLAIAGLIFFLSQDDVQTNFIWKFLKNVVTFSNFKTGKSSSAKSSKSSVNDELPDMPPLPRTGPILSEAELYKLAETHSNVPITFYERWNKLPTKSKRTSSPQITVCPNVKLTSILSLKHSNFYWQTVSVRVNGTTGTTYADVHLLNAYLDDRGGPKRTLVKILGATKKAKSIVPKTAPQASYSCLLWFEGERTPVLAPVIEVYNFHQLDGAYGPVLFSCLVPEIESTDRNLVSQHPQLPVAISLQPTVTGHPVTCATVQQYPTNNLRVIVSKKSKKEKRTFHPTASVGVCARALRFEPYADDDFPVRLVEWLETLKILGADKVYLYVYHEEDEEVPPLEAVLEEYQAEGLVELHRISFPGEQLNGMRVLYELLSHENPVNRITIEKKIFFYQQMYELHDCLYRNLHRHQYIAQIDTNELIVPQEKPEVGEGVITWPELLVELEKTLPKASFDRVTHFRNHMALVHSTMEVTKLTGSPEKSENTQIPWYLYTSRHIFRDLPKTALAKAFYRTDKVVAYYPYSAFRCTNLPTGSGGGCPYHMIPETKSLLLNYAPREDKNAGPTSSVVKKYLPDRTIWRYYEQLKDNVEHKLAKIFLKKKKLN